MIDLHSHLLPGIDDGPSTLDQSLELAALAYQNGITHSILTPHIHPGRYTNNAKTISKACSDFAQALSSRGIPLKVGFAGEVRLSDEILMMVENEDIPFYGKLNQHNVLLLELPHNHVPAGSEKLIQWLLNKNIRPMIAHPERNKEIMSNLDKIKPFVQMECLIQVTAGSIVGLFGQTAQQCSRSLLEMGLVTVIASDAHNVKYRPPQLDHGRDAAAKILGEDEANRMVFDRPANIASSQFPDLLNPRK